MDGRFNRYLNKDFVSKRWLYLLDRYRTIIKCVVMVVAVSTVRHQPNRGVAKQSFP
jgi:hypothetical protein